METLKYSIIKSEEQYNQYCDILEQLLISSNTDKSLSDEIDLLTLLIEKWDEQQYISLNLDPIELIKFLLKEHQLLPKDLALILGLSKGTVSKILNYKKGLSKETIRKLSVYFKLSQEAFNIPTKRIETPNRSIRSNRMIKS
jgi:HTH-type transcriptional regulator / antitoxin HigA